MIGSIVRIVVWLTIALCNFTIVSYVKTNRSRKEGGKDEGKNRKEEGGNGKEEGGNGKDEGGKEGGGKEDITPITHDNPFRSLLQEWTTFVDEGGREGKEGNKIQDRKKNVYPPENVITFVFLGMGVFFSAISLVMDQQGVTSYVGLPLFMSIILVCFGLGGVAAMVILSCLSLDDGEKVANLACVLTGVVFLGGLSLFQRCM